MLAIIRSFESKCSPDIYGINIKLLKFVDTAICNPLAFIFNLSIKDGLFPEKLKISRVVPIFKAGDQRECNNYRPISLVMAFSKIIEKIVAIKLINHLEINKLLTPQQFGFQRNLSTEHAILHLTNFVTEALNENKYAVGVFLDLQKAFDVVSHDILLEKLSCLGIKNEILGWFKSYLSDRVQCVDINGNLSTNKTINISVMQGSVLGPLLFLCFINDIPNISEVLRLLLFADDTCALDSDPNLTTLINRMNIELQKLTDWFLINKISVNITKCKYIIFHRNKTKIAENTPPIILNTILSTQTPNINSTIPLERVHKNNENNKYYKYLGILIDENLNLNLHVDNLCKKLNRALFCLNRTKHLLDLKALKLLYYSLFHSHLLYCNIIFSLISQTNTNRISILQKKAIRTITNSTYNAHTPPLFLALKILPFEKIILLNQSLFMHTIQYQYCHTSFKDVFVTNNQRNHDHMLRNLNNYYVPFPRYDFFKKSPLYTLPNLWNELPDELKYQSNKYTFKIATINHFFGLIETESQNS